MSNEGKKYKSKKINKYCKKNSIKKVYSPPYYPEINGKAENINITLRNSVKTLMYWDILSENFWKFAVKHACYIYMI